MLQQVQTAKETNNIYPLAEKLLNAKKSQLKGDPFKKDEFTSLRDIAMDVVAANFFRYPDLKGVPERLKNIIIEKTQKDLPITLSAPHIQEESYWKEASLQRWNKNNVIKIEMHGMLWKNAYLERNLQEVLEKIENMEDPQTKATLIDILKASNFWLHNLKVSQMKCSLDLNIITLYLPLLTSLELGYGVKHAGFEFKKNLFGIKLSEAANLGEAIKENCKNLLYLNLRENQIDDDILRFIMIGLNMNISLIELNLSHNKISEQGARRIAKYLMRNDILLELDLSDNLIGYEGSRYISQAIKINKTLQKLNLRLNNINDKAGMKFFRDVAINRSLIELNLSANSLGSETAGKLADYLSDPQCTLKVLDISANNFSEESYETLKTGFFKNISLSKLDIRQNKFKNPEYERELTEIIIKHDLNSQKIPFISKFDYIDLKERKQKKIEEIKQKDEALATSSPKKKGIL